MKVYTLESMLLLKCTVCQREFEVKPYRKDAKFCSQKCYGLSNIGKIPKSAFKKGQRPSKKTEFQKGEKHLYWGKSSPAKGKHWSLSNLTKKKMSEVRLGKQHRRKKGYKVLSNTGEKNCKWIKDRSLIKRQEERNNPNDKQWKYAVYKRDNFKCRLNDKNCSGKIVAHHILAWRKYPELRFVVSNGITLCKFHHPLKEKDENNMIPIFKNIIMSL